MECTYTLTISLQYGIKGGSMDKGPDFNVSQAKLSNMRVYSGRYKFEEGDLVCSCQMEENMRNNEAPHQNISGVAYFPIHNGKYAWFFGQCMDCGKLRVFLVEEKEVFMLEEVVILEDVEENEVSTVGGTLPVTKNFNENNVIGKASSFNVKDGELHCKIEINDWEETKDLWNNKSRFSVGAERPKSSPDRTDIDQVTVVTDE